MGQETRNFLGTQLLTRRYPDRPLIGVAAVVFEAGRVLLIRRAKAPRLGEWSLPGGLQKLGETVHAAACREVLEEAGVTVRVRGVVDVVDLIERDESDGRVRYHFTLVDLVACRIGGETRARSDAAEVAWFELTTLPRLRLWSETERVIRLARRNWPEVGTSN